jgi:hypothetical protein
MQASRETSYMLRGRPVKEASRDRVAETQRLHKMYSHIPVGVSLLDTLLEAAGSSSQGGKHAASSSSSALPGLGNSYPMSSKATVASSRLSLHDHKPTAHPVGYNFLSMPLQHSVDAGTQPYHGSKEVVKLLIGRKAYRDAKELADYLVSQVVKLLVFIEVRAWVQYRCRCASHGGRCLLLPDFVTERGMVARHLTVSFSMLHA